MILPHVNSWEVGAKVITDKNRVNNRGRVIMNASGKARNPMRLSVRLNVGSPTHSFSIDVSVSRSGGLMSTSNRLSFFLALLYLLAELVGLMGVHHVSSGIQNRLLCILSQVVAVLVERGRIHAIETVHVLH